jgi:vacuolar-type H+-ATPase subunit H
MSQCKYREKIIREAINEARRFIERAEVALDGMIGVDYYHGGRENAMMKRASLDLSITLAQIRKPLE